MTKEWDFSKTYDTLSGLKSKAFDAISFGSTAQVGSIFLNLPYINMSSTMAAGPVSPATISTLT
jgi:hypothetical protein